MADTPRRRHTPPRKKTPDADGQVTHVRYSRAVARKICDRLAAGESWFSLCNTEGFPCYGSLYAWRKRHPEFARSLDEAREMGADRNADRALAIAEATTRDTVAADRLKVATLMKHAALSSPRRWGRKAEAVEKAEAPRQVEVVFRVRHFERAVRPDGTTYVREILPEEDA